MRTAASFIMLLACVASANCAGTITPPRTSPRSAAREALVVLPGFGYSRSGERAIRAAGPALRDAGFDLYAPHYIRRAGLHSSGDALRQFFREQRLDRYDRVHVFAFLAGGWTFNALARDPSVLPNLATVVYDRSPYQERAPRLAAENLRLISWLRYGPVLFEMATTPYPQLPRSGIKVGLIVETRPTGLLKRFRRTAQSYGPYAFECRDFGQPHDDCIYAAISHDEVYTRFGEIWPELRAFIRDGRFEARADRTAPRGSDE